MSKLIIIDGKHYRIRRGKLVLIPEDWIGNITTKKTIRQRKSKLPSKKLKRACLFIEDTDKRRTRVLVCSDTNNILYESQSLESMLYTIDFLKFVK